MIRKVIVIRIGIRTIVIRIGIRTMVIRIDDKSIPELSRYQARPSSGEGKYNILFNGLVHQSPRPLLRNEKPGMTRLHVWCLSLTLK